MSQIIVNTSDICGKIKIMHAVNNGPTKPRADQTRGNFDSYKAARIPYARNHDASHCAAYGGCHIVDVACIFRDFNADPDDPANYDFHLTDEYVNTIADAGTETFYRLGASIEHWSKKYNTIPPPDFHKWAVICEHIIAHYTEGWANGFHNMITYWEIWNEPDLDNDDSLNKRCWGGTELQFQEFFRVAATHLKKRFPHLKIGGPALAWKVDWLDRLLAVMSGNGDESKRIPLDFISWHIYFNELSSLEERAIRVREIMEKYGYGNAESILNEWNYIKGWGTEYIYSLEVIAGLKGAAFTAASLLKGQHLPVDMMMYYDARISSGFNGMWNILTLRPQKTYYSIYAFADLYELKNQVRTSCDDDNVQVVAAKGDDGTLMAYICYYTDDDNATDPKTVTVRFEGETAEGFHAKLVDETHDLTDADILTVNGDTLTFELKPNTFVQLIKKA